jgi:protoporphyrinogen oxidase
MTRNYIIFCGVDLIAHVIILGTGAMGLAAAFQALQDGHTVEVLEAANEPGGMAAHFDFEGLSIERYYHFICKTDKDTFQMLDDLGIADTLRWRSTTMGVYTGGKLYDWGNPVALLKFSPLSLIGRLRYALFAFVCVHRNSWNSIEREDAASWIKRWCGMEVFEQMWKPLLHLKFFQYENNISSTWIWTRVRRIGRSRKSLMEEKLGYLEGGSQTLVDALVKAIEERGGVIRLSSPATKVVSENGVVTGVETPQGFRAADAVISTVPTPLISGIVPALSPETKAKYEAIHNIGICCLIFKLKKSVTPHFWVNISSPEIEVPGMIEFSNLRPIEGSSVVYVPYYMPVDHEKFSWTDERLLSETFSYIQKVNPAITDDDVIDARVARLRHAQPICEPGFMEKLPPVQTEIAGLQIADTCFYYPEDRGISESIRFGREMAARVPR